jgi:hypothetical protein
MKQKLFPLFILLLYFQLKTFCQSLPCKFQTNDGKTIITDSTTGRIIHGFIQVVKTGSDYKLHLKFVTAIPQKTPPYKIVKGQLLKIFLQNKDTVSLAANESKTGIIFYDPHQPSSAVYDDYNVSAADLKRILASPGEGVEVNFSLGDGTARNMDLLHNLFHNLFFNLFGCVMK